jgi:hypothetical protein
MEGKRKEIKIVLVMPMVWEILLCHFHHLHDGHDLGG